VLLVLLVLVGGGGAAFWFWNRTSLLVENRLVEPIQLVVAGTRQTIDPGGEVRVSLPRDANGSVVWFLVRPTTPQGVAMGLEIQGQVSFEAARTSGRLVIDGLATDPPAFAPLITNTTAGPLSITVNAGLSGSLDCGCLIPAGANRARIGYYPLYQNSTVRAQDQRRRTVAFGDLGPDVDQASGSVGLRFEDKDFRE
jgi:hypothetical protein